MGHHLNLHFELIREQLKLVEQEFVDQLFSYDPKLRPFLDYLISQKGKLLRPAIFLLTAKCLSEIKPLHIKIATVFEMIHHATLLHDDVIDNAKLRRGKQTANDLYGNEKAILLGDLVLATAFKMANQIEQLNVRQELADMVSRLCTGEIMQNLSRNNFELTEEQYISLINDKTASFFAATCRVACLMAQADESILESFSCYGKNLGLAFQIKDDIADIVDSEEATGKTLGTDLELSKLTLPVIYYLQSNTLPDNITSQQLADLLKSSDAVDRSRQKVIYYCNEAGQSIKDVDGQQAKISLVEIAESIAKF